MNVYTSQLHVGFQFDVLLNLKIQYLNISNDYGNNPEF